MNGKALSILICFIAVHAASSCCHKSCCKESLLLACQPPCPLPCAPPCQQAYYPQYQAPYQPAYLPQSSPVACCPYRQGLGALASPYNTGLAPPSGVGFFAGPLPLCRCKLCKAACPCLLKKYLAAKCMLKNDLLATKLLCKCGA